jgi:hypothetical protein
VWRQAHRRKVLVIKRERDNLAQVGRRLVERPALGYRA